MTISIKTLKVLVKKEIIDLPKNTNVSLMCLIPIILVLLFSKINVDNISQGLVGVDLLNMGLNTNLIIVSTFAISMLIAEEKEKNTIRTLMLSLVTPAEFLVGKAIVIFLFSIVTNTAIYFIVGLGLQYLVQYIFWSIIVTIIMIEIGGIIGLIAENQVSTGVIGIPVIFAFIIIPMMAQANDIFEKIALILPNYNLNMVLKSIINGEGYANTSYSKLIALVWLILSTIALIYTYNRKNLDKQTIQ